MNVAGNSDRSMRGSDGPGALRLLVFEVGGVLFAVNLAKMHSCIPLDLDRLTPPEQSENGHYLGDLQLEEGSTPVIHLPEYLKQPDDRPLSEWTCLVVQLNDQKIVFAASEVMQDIAVPWDKVIPPVESLAHSSVVTGYVIWRSKVIQLLDFEKIRDEVLGSPYSLKDFKKITPDGFCVLFAEDSSPIRSLIIEIFERNNIRTIACSNGSEAWEKFQQEHENIDLIVTDIEMPLKDGTSLVKDVRRHEKGRDVPIILISSMGLEKHAEHYRKIGANAFVHKNNLEQLSETIQQLMNPTEP